VIVRNLIFEGSLEFAGDSHDPVGFNDVLCAFFLNRLEASSKSSRLRCIPSDVLFG